MISNITKKYVRNLNKKLLIQIISIPILCFFSFFILKFVINNIFYCANEFFIYLQDEYINDNIDFYLKGFIRLVWLFIIMIFSAFLILAFIYVTYEGIIFINKLFKSTFKDINDYDVEKAINTRKKQF